jgi:uncharacterized SAM-binding protein YcdF (DUF218 family)
MIYLHKILPTFLLPLGIVIVFLLLGASLKRRSFIWVGLIILALASSPIVSMFSVKLIESDYPERLTAQEAQTADAIVVLSSGRKIAPGKARVSEWGDANRFYGGIELFKASRAPKLIFTGGWAPWEPASKPEGDVSAQYAMQLGVPKGSIFISKPVLNTAEEAVGVAELLGQEKNIKPISILLVTSSYHMERAKQLFELAGFKVFPFPVDFQRSRDHQITLIDFFPSANALAKNEMVVRELYGRAYYSLRNNYFKK